ncbi:MAG: type IV pilus modification protein PilV [Pseudomonadales bacterium]|nr:type IV pilus modification protein PilV [Pseudomonadales bacterium]HAU15140.1 type IV pilus modification protein PilV [Gammaproteobacteria bacterium]HBO91899.1 type IV pilus modification protein PilV [Gammaproteobacteria bacterium]|tara:strand:- start:1344 stop:1847 length:504 start_codon:yes stop_codon:yes gene_type:complete
MLIKSCSFNGGQQQGVGLIEVLVSVLVLTVGILGVVAMQTRALQFSQESIYTSQALMMAYEMTDRMRANKGSEIQYLVNYGSDVTALADCESTDCTPTQMAKFDAAAWKNAIAVNLPSGDGQIAVDNAGSRPFYTISVRFTDQKLDSALEGGTAGSSLREVSVRTEI